MANKNNNNRMQKIKQQTAKIPETSKNRTQNNRE